MAPSRAEGRKAGKCRQAGRLGRTRPAAADICHIRRKSHIRQRNANRRCRRARV